MARCVVIGANGFLGSHLVDELVSQGHEVTAFDRFSVLPPAFTAAGVTRVAGDFLNREDVAQVVSGQDYVFHFLSTTTPATAENDPSLDVRTNIASSIDLFTSCADAGVRKVFFASTGGAIYGDQAPDTSTELSMPRPVSPYAIGKLAIEGYLDYFGRKSGLDAVSFRISNPYGPRQREHRRQGVIPIFLHRLLEGRPVTVYGDGSMVRDYVYVNDAVRMVAATVDRPTKHSVYNVGSGVGTSVIELLEVIERVTGIMPRIEHEPLPPTFLHRSVLDTTRYLHEFGSTVPRTLEDGIRSTWAELTASSAALRRGLE